MSVDKGRQASAKQDQEVEITPEMIEAGASFLKSSGWIHPNQADWACRELAEDMLREMMRARGSAGARPTSTL